MKHVYQIDPNLDVPIYRQLVDSIRTSIKQGSLASGQQLPTVQEMSDQLHIARGTIKRVYDELERAGLVEKVQGRGTFVRYQPADSQSRKEQAMSAIDEMLDKLADMGFSAAEINIFLNLKLRERAEEESSVRVAVIECNPETLSHMAQQLRHIPQVEIYSYLLDSVQQYPYKLGEELDLIVTTASHAEGLEGILPVRKRICRVALRPSPRCLSHIIRLRGGQKVGIVSGSARFGQLLKATCQGYAEETELMEPVTMEEDLTDYLKGLDAVLVPKHYEKYGSAEAVDALHRFPGELIDCYYEMDEGSVLYLEAKIKRLLDDKKL